MILSILIALLIGYGALLALIYFFQDKFIFFPTPSTEPAESEVMIRTPDGIRLQGIWVRREKAAKGPVILYFGGNAEEASRSLHDFARQEGFSTLLVNYRGYGRSEGKPGEQELKRDGEFILGQWLPSKGIEPGQVVLMGRSLGSGVAVYLASKFPVRAVILVTPFDSMVKVGQRHYPIFPIGLLLKHRFDSLALAPEIKTTLLMITAGSDTIIPAAASENLFKAWGGPKEKVVIEGADHNDLSLDPVYWESVKKFLKRGR